MIFQDLITQTKWENVKRKLLKLYPDEHKNLDGYRDVWYQLVYILKPEIFKDLNEKNIEILICEKVDDLFNDYENIYYDVVGWDGNQRWAIEFLPWEEWLGMKINKETLKKFSYEEIAVHCIWEMTYCGFDQQQIKNKIDELKRRVEEVENGEVELVSLEDVLKELENKNDNVVMLKDYWSKEDNIYDEKYGELIELDEAIEHAEQKKNMQLVKWLRELKEYKEKYR